MTHYKSNLRDLEFNLFEVFGADRAFGQEPYTDLDVDTARTFLAEMDRLAREDLAASYTDSDRNPPVFDPATHTAPLPESFKKSYQAFMDSEFWRLDLPAELDGSNAPRMLWWALAELVLGSNAPIWMYASGPSFAHVLRVEGTERQKKWAKLFVDKQWGSTMVLTEPDAGSDVGAGRARAIPQPDGSWHIEGVKRFITSGEHDLSDNIVHYVLARPVGVEGVGGPGTKGLSLFVVPKYHFDEETGELGERNGVYATNVEHKMGLKVSNTCELTFGEHGVPAKGWLMGDKHDGIRQMFMIIEYARMLVGTKAIATLSTGYLNALEYAKNRVQGADLLQSTDKTAPGSPSPTTPTYAARCCCRSRTPRVCGRWSATPPPGRTRSPSPRRPVTRRPPSWPSGSTTCCCPWSRASARSARTSCSGTSPCRPSVAPASSRTTRWSSTSGTPRSTLCTRAPRRSRAST